MNNFKDLDHLTLRQPQKGVEDLNSLFSDQQMFKQ
jgi:hypothetical protein